MRPANRAPVAVWRMSCSLVAQSQDEHAGGGTEAGEVPGAHGALDEVVAEVLDVEQHDRVDGPVCRPRGTMKVASGMTMAKMNGEKSLIILSTLARPAPA